MAKENFQEFKKLLSTLSSSRSLGKTVGDLQRLIDSHQIVISDLINQRKSLITYRDYLNKLNQNISE